MEFDSELCQIQGALMRANNTHNFMDLKYRAGNAKEIKTIVAGVFKLLSDKGYINNDGTNEPQHTQILRRITFFLILNSDLIILNKMVDSDEIGHIIWVTPLISKCVLISFVTELHLIGFYCEGIAYSYPPLSVELLELAAQNINYTTPEQRIKHVNLLVSSAYAMVARFSEYPLEESMQRDIFSLAYEKVHELLKCFVEAPIKNKEDNKWNTNKLNEYLGQRQLSMFQLLINCFNIFEKKRKEIDTSDYDIYFTTYYVYTKNDASSNNSDIVIEYLSKLNELLLDTAKLCIMHISIDLFCCWFEYKERKHSDKTLQLAVGEQAYALQQIILNNPSLEHEIGNMLDAISTKPAELKDFIKGADRNEILRKSNDVSNTDQHDWLASLIKRDYFFQDKECLECVTKYIYILKETDDIRFIIEQAKKLLLSEIKNEHPDSLKLLFFASLSRLTHDDQVSFIIGMFSDHEIGNLLELPDHDAQMTEFLNKLVSVDSENLFWLYKIFIQNPEKCCKEITNQCTINTKHVHRMLEVIQKLSVFNDIRFQYRFDISKYEKSALSNMSLLFLSSVCEINTDLLETERQCDSYLCLMSGLREKEILNGHTILLQLVLPKLQYNLTSKNFKGVLIQLRVLDLTFARDLFVEYLAPLLVVLSQVFESVRWDLKSFSAVAVDVIEVAVRLQKTIMDKFIELKTPEDKDFKWISTKLSKLSPMTAYYYQRLWPNNPFKGFFDRSLEMADIQKTLCYLLPRCTMEEFKEICKYLNDEASENTAVKTLCHVLVLISSASDELKLENSYACVDYCCRNLASFFQDLMKSDDSTIDKSTILENIIELLTSLPEHLENGCFLCFLSVISDICHSLHDSGVDMETVKKSLKKIENPNSQESLSLIFIRVQSSSRDQASPISLCLAPPKGPGSEE